MQGVELRQDVENGILFTNYSLVLQKITRNQKTHIKLFSNYMMGYFEISVKRNT